MKLFIRIILVVLLIVITAYRLLTDINQPIARWDEQRNIEVVQETISKGSFPILYRLNEPFFEKPPLWYLINTSIHIPYTSTLTSMRILSIVFSILTFSLMIVFMWKKFGYISSLVTWIMLLLSHQLFIRDPGGIFSSHTLVSADADTLQILFMVISFISLTSKHPRAQLVAGIATGLAVLTKGPLGFVPLLAFFLINKNVKTALVATCAIILPWYIFMFLKFGQDFIQMHISYHLIVRTIYPIEGHGESLFYYVQILTNIFVYPAMPFVLISLLLLKKIHQISFILKFVCTISLFLLVIPSLMGTKLAWYILPLYPFLAIFVGIISYQILEFEE